MIKRLTLAALAVAFALATTEVTPVHADSHNEQDKTQLSNFQQSVAAMSDGQLRELIGSLKARASQNNSRIARKQLQLAKRELARRGNQAGGGGASDNERAASELLQAGPAAKALDTPALEARANTARRLINEPGLRKKTRKRLNKLLSRDRAELQRRKTAQQVSPAERQARRLVRGEDPRRLKTKGLRERINKARRLLETGELRRPTRQSLNDFLARDRAELQNRQASQQVPRAEREARQLLRGPQAQDLRSPALSQRIDSARSLLGTGELTRKTQRRLDQLLASDLAVLKARQAQQQQPSRAERRARRLLDGAPASSQLDAAALRERINTARKLLQSDELRRRTRRDLNELVKSDRTALAGLDQQRPASRAERDARDLLASSISPQQMKTRALRQRIRDARALLQEPDVRRRTRNRLQERVDQDVAELRARQDSQTQASAADDQARELLSDRRAAAQLNERQLRRRLRETRDLLQDQQLSRRLSRRLRQQLSLDRRELRRRLEARRLQDENIVITQPRGDAAAALLNDRRASHSLRTKALSRRIKATQRVLNGGGLNNRDQSELADLLRSDRRELRQRLRNRRDRRRAQLERQRRNNELNIVIAPRLEYAPRDDVAAAEADDQIIERQLVAPPTRRIERRYTLEEFRRQPELRSYMPAIEVDSIHFGFNEHWVREEEIDELERIGSVIERVVAANPDEVFLIEGHTDAVGSGAYNLDLSRKRADAVRNALVEYFVIPRENLAPIGYGERFLKIPTPEEEQENRRVSVRRITPLLASR